MRPKVQYRENPNGDWYWKLVVPHYGDSDVVCGGMQGYANFTDCKAIAEKILRGEFSGAIQLSERLPKDDGNG